MHLARGQVFGWEGALVPLAIRLGNVDSAPAMSRFLCERCGAQLSLSISESAYICTAAPSEHVFPRLETERRWLDERRARAEQDPSNVAAALAFAEVHGRIGAVAFASGDPVRGGALFADELALLEALHRAHPQDAGVRGALLESLGVQAQLAEESGQVGTCITVLERMLSLAEALRDERPMDDRWLGALSHCHNGLGRMYRHMGDDARAAEHFKGDLAVVEVMRASKPNDAELGTSQAVAHFNLYLTSGDEAEETAHLHEAIRIVDEMEQAGMATQDALAVRGRATLVMRQRPAPAASRAGEAGSTATPADLRAWLVERVDKELRARHA